MIYMIIYLIPLIFSYLLQNEASKKVVSGSPIA